MRQARSGKQRPKPWGKEHAFVPATKATWHLVLTSSSFLLKCRNSGPDFHVRGISLANNLLKNYYYSSSSLSSSPGLITPTFPPRVRLLFELSLKARSGVEAGKFLPLDKFSFSWVL